MARQVSLWWAGLGSFLLLMELLLRLLPVSTSTESSYYTDPLIVTYPPHHQWTTSTGWDLRNPQRLESNNLGYAASRDFGRNEQAVVLIGDSFVEASMLPEAARPGMQLERALGSRPVFAMGSPGTALLDYAERIRFAAEQFGVRDFVILMERSDVKQSLCGSGNISGPCLDSQTLLPTLETAAPPGTAKRIFRHSALAQYVFGQLKFSPQRLWQQAFPPPHSSAPAKPSNGTITRPVEEVPAYVDVVSAAFFDRIKPYVKGKLVIVVDSDRRVLATGQSSPDAARDRFMKLARAAGAIVVDTEPLFEAHHTQSPLKLEVGPYDGHLNALGVKLVTQAAAEALVQP